jgi:LytS/YehU family sensor histidine kinase
LQASRSDWHPLATEFERLSDYLALMQVRMGPRLRASLDLPDDLRDSRVPPLLLQPLVENSIQHGLEPKTAGGALRVSAWCEGQSLCLAVEDTGLGLSPAGPPGAAHADAAPASPKAKLGTGFGLEQVRARLQTLYGQRASLQLGAGPGGVGVRAQVTLPLEPL